jgi:acetolactate synthase small subunit
VFEVSGALSKIDKFEALMKPLGLVEIARTGVLSFAPRPNGADAPSPHFHAPIS